MGEEEQEFQRICLVVDAPAEIQRWVDALVSSARAGGPPWPHPHPSALPTVVSVAEVCTLVEQTFQKDGLPWSVAKWGLPPIATEEGGTFGSPLVEPDEPDPLDPDPGSSAHNLWHRIFG